MWRSGNVAGFKPQAFRVQLPAPVPIELPMRRSKVVRDLRSPKYRPRVIPNKKKQASKKACRKP